MSEVTLTPETISRFRRNYIEAFGAPSRDDALYAAVSEGRRFAGMEHWLPFFYERLETLFDYLPDAPCRVRPSGARGAGRAARADPRPLRGAQDAGASGALQGRRALQAGASRSCSISRRTKSDGRSPGRAAIELHAVRRARCRAPCAVCHAGARPAAASPRSAPTRTSTSSMPSSGTSPTSARPAAKVIVAGWTDGSLDRLGQILAEHQLGNARAGSRRWPRLEKLEAGRRRPGRAAARSRLRDRAASSSSPSRTFWATAWCGARSGASGRPISSPKRPRLAAGDIVVHADHGIGRFIGLRTIEAAGAPHDCLEIHYAGDDRLFLPVENIELLSRYGSDAAEAMLDKLGGGAWQSRKARLKQRLLDMAGQLIRIAAERQMRAAPALIAAGGPLWRVLRALPL